MNAMIVIFNIILILLKIRIYTIITTNCTNPEIGDELVNLFKGCSDNCCSDRRYYHNPSTEPSTGFATITPIITDCEDRITSTTQHFQTPYSTIHEPRITDSSISTSMVEVSTSHHNNMRLTVIIVYSVIPSIFWFVCAV